MIKLKKDGTTMAVRDSNQAAAFLNNGWITVGDEDFSKHMNPPIETKEVADEKTSYTKTDINRLSTAELKDLATKEGISDVENKSGGELKKELIEHYGL